MKASSKGPVDALPHGGNRRGFAVRVHVTGWLRKHTTRRWRMMHECCSQHLFCEPISLDSGVNNKKSKPKIRVVLSTPSAATPHPTTSTCRSMWRANFAEQAETSDRAGCSHKYPSYWQKREKDGREEEER